MISRGTVGRRLHHRNPRRRARRTSSSVRSNSLQTMVATTTRSTPAKQLAHPEHLAPGEDDTAESARRPVHLRQQHAGDREDQPHAQTFEDQRLHRRQVDLQIDLAPRGAEGARRGDETGGHRAGRRNAAEHHDEEGEGDREDHLLQEADAEGEDEDRKEDRFGDRQQQVEGGREHAVRREILSQEEADPEPERCDDRECDGDLRQGDDEVAAKALVLQEAAEHPSHLGERRQQPRIGEPEPARRLPGREHDGDEDERTEPDQPSRHVRPRGTRARFDRLAPPSCPRIARRKTRVNALLSRASTSVGQQVRRGWPGQARHDGGDDPT